MELWTACSTRSRRANLDWQQRPSSWHPPVGWPHSKDRSASLTSTRTQLSPLHARQRCTDSSISTTSKTDTMKNGLLDYELLALVTTLRSVAKLQTTRQPAGSQFCTPAHIRLCLSCFCELVRRTRSQSSMPSTRCPPQFPRGRSNSLCLRQRMGNIYRCDLSDGQRMELSCFIASCDKVFPEAWR